MYIYIRAIVTHLIDKHLVQPHWSKRGLDDVGDCCRRGNVLCSDVLWQQTIARDRSETGASRVCMESAQGLHAISIFAETGGTCLLNGVLSRGVVLCLVGRCELGCLENDRRD